MKKFVLLFILILIPFKVSALASTASSAILMDVDSGRVLYEKNKNIILTEEGVIKAEQLLNVDELFDMKTQYAHHLLQALKPFPL